MESSDNLASTHKTFTYHRHYYSVVYISFLWDGGGVKILWYNILTPPSILSKIWRNNFRILALCRYDKSTIIAYISSFLFKVSRGGQNIIGGVKILQ